MHSPLLHILTYPEKIPAKVKGSMKCFQIIKKKDSFGILPEVTFSGVLLLILESEIVCISLVIEWRSQHQ
jgi:hypothetical protein